MPWRRHCASARRRQAGWLVACACACLTGGSAAPSVQAEPVQKASSCWTVGFTHEDCCAPEFGPEGNSQCWDEVYTYAACCGGSGGDPSDEGCESEYFARFRGLVHEYYSTGRARPALIELFPRVLANFDARFALCAPAALQAALLQIEERSALESSAATADRLASYALRLQHGVEVGALRGADVKAWPLEQGLQRVRTEANRKARRLARRRPSIALVLSYCRERLDWMNSTLSRRVLPRIDLAVVCKCPNKDALAAVPFRRLWRSVTVLDVEDLPLRADECSAYLGYIAHEYQRLPDQLIFVHADAPEHVGSLDRPNILDDTIVALLQGVHVPFAHLGGNRVTMRWDASTMAVLWRGLFKGSTVPGPGMVKTYCCSHFVVSRERVLQRPRAFYVEALDFVTSPRSYSYLPAGKPHAFQDDMAARLVCQNMMFVWHVIFGEDLDLPHRMFDPKLPLFLKLRNLRTAYMDL